MKIRLKVCDQCSFAELQRVHRTFWMRLLGSFRHYHCAQCKSRFLAPKGMVEQRQWMDTTTRDFRPQGAGRKKA